MLVLSFLYFYRLLSANNTAILGWLARIPSPKTCPTSHRYLRSSFLLEEDEDLYLGGPISMANYDKVNRVICIRCLSSNEIRRNKVAVYKAPGRKIIPGQEVVWSYNLNATKRKYQRFYHQKDWQLVGA